MFDGVLPEVTDQASLTDAELVDAAGGWVRAENAACARKLAVMAEMFARTGLAAGDRSIVVNRLRWDEPTKRYLERRTQEGKTKKEIIRCLKRAVVRELYRALQADLNPRLQALDAA